MLHSNLQRGDLTMGKVINWLKASTNTNSFYLVAELGVSFDIVKENYPKSQPGSAFYESEMAEFLTTYLGDYDSKNHYELTLPDGVTNDMVKQLGKNYLEEVSGNYTPYNWEKITEGINEPEFLTDSDDDVRLIFFPKTPFKKTESPAGSILLSFAQILGFEQGYPLDSNK
jgi:hypothetical protein